MAALSTSFVSPQTRLSHGCLKPTDQCLMCNQPTNLSLRSAKTNVAVKRGSLIVRAAGDGGRQNSATAFIGGFVLGGIVVGTLGCVFAPQISKAIAGADRKDLMRRLPKFIYDEEKQLEKTRKILTEKIDQLNAAIDEVSSQLRPDDAPNGTAVNSKEVEAST